MDFAAAVASAQGLGGPETTPAPGSPAASAGAVPAASALTPESDFNAVALGRGVRPDAIALTLELLGATEDEEVKLADIAELSDFSELVAGLSPPLQRGKILAIWRLACSLGVGAANTKTGSTEEANQATTPEPPAPLVPPPELLKVAEYAVQQDPRLFPMLSDTELGQARKRYLLIKRLPPAEVERPGDAQLSVLAHLVGRGKAPFVDLALFGPHGERFALSMKTQQTYYVGHGEWATHRLPGLKDHAAWEQAYAVWANSMLMLGYASVGSLERYQRGMREMVLYFRKWGQLRAADEKMRREQWPRLASEARQRLITIPDYNEASPWDSVIAYSAWDPQGGHRTFWFHHVDGPLTHRKDDPDAAVEAFEGSTRKLQGNKRRRSPGPDVSDASAAEGDAGAGSSSNKRNRNKRNRKKAGAPPAKPPRNNGNQQVKPYLKPTAKKGARSSK